MLWRFALVIPLVLLTLLSMIPGSINDPHSGWLEHVQESYQTRPEKVWATMVCQHRDSVDQIIDLLETETGNKAIQFTVAKLSKAGECVRFPEPINLNIDEYTPFRGPISVDSSPTLFEAVRVRKFWTILGIPIHTS